MAEGDRLREQGSYAAAEKAYQAARVDLEDRQESGPRLAATLNNLGEVYRLQGRYLEAEHLYRRALALQETAQEPNNQVAATVNNLALLYRAQGRNAEAERLFKPDPVRDRENSEFARGALRSLRRSRRSR